MEPKLISEKQIIAAARAIRAAGPGEVSERIFNQIVLPGASNITSRNIAVANLVAAISPAHCRNEWYVTSLFRGTSKYLHPNELPEEFAYRILREAGVSAVYASALKELAISGTDFYECNDLALTILFCDLCTTQKGTYTRFTGESSSEDTGEGDQDKAYMYWEVKVLLGQRGLLDKYERLLEKEIKKGGTGNGRSEEKKRALGKKQICAAP
jgi:hypothetical protein